LRVYASAMTARGIWYLVTSCLDGFSIICAIVPRMSGAAAASRTR
jgi:hypothetical protein